MKTESFFFPSLSGLFRCKCDRVCVNMNMRQCNFAEEWWWQSVGTSERTNEQAGGDGMSNNQLNQFKIQSKFNQFLCVAENMNNKIILSRADECVSLISKAFIHLAWL